jgi:hypothetical protein
MPTRGIAWAAGLYEGEGCVCMGLSGGYRSPRITLGMTDREPVEWFREVLGFGTICTRRRQAEGYKDIYRFEVSGWVRTGWVREWFAPFLSPRRLAQFDACLAQRPVPPTAPDCGMASEPGYARHKRRHEPACQPCRDAHTLYERQRTGARPRYPDGLGYMRPAPDFPAVIPAVQERTLTK